MFVAAVEHFLRTYPEMSRIDAIQLVRDQAAAFCDQRSWLLFNVPSDVCYIGLAPTPDAAEAIADYLAAVGECDAYQFRQAPDLACC